MSDVVTYESTDHIALITINRPEKRNALNQAVVDQLNAAWKRFAASEDRVAVLTGAGDAAFSAGIDLNEPPSSVVEAIPSVGVPLDKPVIAAVSGYCMGGSWGLLQHSDLAVATRSARIIYPEAHLGYSGGLVAGLVSRIPAKIAMELMLLGDWIDGQRAYEIGFVNRLVEDGEHLTTAIEMARRVAQAAPLVVRLLKRHTDATLPKSPAEQAAHTQRENRDLFNSAEAKEGFEAYKAKRAPNSQSH